MRFEREAFAGSSPLCLDESGQGRNRQGGMDLPVVERSLSHWPE